MTGDSVEAVQEQVSGTRHFFSRVKGRLGRATRGGRSVDGRLDALARSVDAQEASLKQMVRLLGDIRKEATTSREYLGVLWSAATAEPMRHAIHFAETRQLTFRETLERLAADNLSFARFGDGEFRLMTDPTYNLRFQRNSPELRAALREVLTGPSHESLMIGWPRPFRTVHNTNVWTLIWEEVRPLVPDGVVYGNSHVSRPVFFTEMREQAVALWRNVWEQRSVCIVTGKDSRFEVIPELFSNLAGHRFVYSSPKDAFEELDELVESIVAENSDDIYLISLGPAGTILADRLARRGKHAIDIGHVSDSYLNVFAGHARPETKPAVRAPST